MAPPNDSPNAFLDHFRHVLRLKPLSLHTEDTDARTAQERLGHKDVRTTMTRRSHAPGHIPTS